MPLNSRTLSATLGPVKHSSEFIGGRLLQLLRDVAVGDVDHCGRSESLSYHSEVFTARHQQRCCGVSQCVLRNVLGRDAGDFQQGL